MLAAVAAAAAAAAATAGAGGGTVLGVVSPGVPFAVAVREAAVEPLRSAMAEGGWADSEAAQRRNSSGGTISIYGDAAEWDRSPGTGVRVCGQRGRADSAVGGEPAGGAAGWLRNAVRRGGASGARGI